MDGTIGVGVRPALRVDPWVLVTIGMDPLGEDGWTCGEGGDGERALVIEGSQLPTGSSIFRREGLECVTGGDAITEAGGLLHEPVQSVNNLSGYM